MCANQEGQGGSREIHLKGKMNKHKNNACGNILGHEKNMLGKGV